MTFERVTTRPETRRALVTVDGPRAFFVGFEVLQYHVKNYTFPAMRAFHGVIIITFPTPVVHKYIAHNR